jgi:hypothetical protein
MTSPAPPEATYPMHVCAVDGIVYDQRRNAWYGLHTPPMKLHCPVCGGTMEGEPKAPPHVMHFCFQCGTTFDRHRHTWYGLVMHAPSP